MKRARCILVVPDPGQIPRIPHAVAVRAEDFLSASPAEALPSATVINLCPAYRYRSRGYYVSLLAEARGHRVIPSLETSEGLSDPYTLFRALQIAHVPTVDLKEMASRRRSVPEEITPDDEGGGERSDREPILLRRVGSDDELSFRPVTDAEVSEQFVYFGHCRDSRFRRACQAVYRVWPTPVLRVRFIHEDDDWKVVQVAPVAALKLEGRDRAQLFQALRNPALLRPPRPEPEEQHVPSVAILYDEMSLFAPSTTETMERLEKIAARMGVHARRIGMNDMARLAEYDALFVRAYTSVTSPAFQFALRAEALGMPVIDDTLSIIRCSNKVFLHELLTREGVPTPRTRVATPHTQFRELEPLGLPFVVKLPDGAFSAAVHKVTHKADYTRHSRALFRKAPLLIAQEWVPSEFDWRVTILGGKVLFTCKYFMARGHWTIRTEDRQGINYGRVEAVHRDYAPRDVVRAALRATRAIGDGLYGVDLKDTPRGPVVIEINDNPNIDIGYEDSADGEIIYEDIIRFFAERIERSRSPRPEPREREPEGADAPFRKPIGPRSLVSKHVYRPFEVCGIELEYPVVDRDLNAVSRVEEAFQAFEGRPTSDVDLGVVGFSNEIMDHVLEVKTLVPLRSLAQTEEFLVEGVQRFCTFLWRRFEARLLPTGMHPWLRPARARLWRRSNARIYKTYERLFPVHSHGWANVQASHVNLPFGLDHEAVAMLNAASLLIPYLPAIAASSPLVEGELQPAVDNRMAYILGHQTRVPESCGDLVPEYCASVRQYKREILGGMYRALDRLPNARAIRGEFFNARGAVFKFSRRALEVRVLDMQECVRMDVAIAAFVRNALKDLTRRVQQGTVARPLHAILVGDFHATIAEGSAARVWAPHLALDDERDEDGKIAVRTVLSRLLDRARDVARADERDYLDLVEGIVRTGTLSERIRHRLEPFVDAGDETFTEAARRIYIELAECLKNNTPWTGRTAGAIPAALKTPAR